MINWGYDLLVRLILGTIFGSFVLFILYIAIDTPFFGGFLGAIFYLLGDVIVERNNKK